MPSAPRDFMAHVPVLITTRCILRADLFDELNIEKKFRQLVARFARRDQVDVFGWVFLRNHLHMLVAQRIHGHDRARLCPLRAYVYLGWLVLLLQGELHVGSTSPAGDPFGQGCAQGILAHDALSTGKDASDTPRV